MEYLFHVNIKKSYQSLGEKMQTINIQEIEGFKFGNAQNQNAMTGVTVIICEDGATAGVDVRGGSPATRETDLLKSENTIERIHAVFLSGGSAYGINCATGIMEYLEKKGKGFDVGVGVVPIVCGACIYDLGIGDPSIRPDSKMALSACINSENETIKIGSVGGGTGATCGKLLGPATMMKSGLGMKAFKVGNLEVGAIVVANPLGDIFNMDNEKIAGLLDTDKKTFISSEDKFIEFLDKSIGFTSSNRSTENNLPLAKNSLNTTIGCIVTNAKLTKAQCNKLSSITHDAFARRIKPCHTSLDGDTIFTMTTGKCDVNFDSVAILSTRAMEEAIVSAATTNN